MQPCFSYENQREALFLIFLNHASGGSLATALDLLHSCCDRNECFYFLRDRIDLEIEFFWLVLRVLGRHGRQLAISRMNTALNRKNTNS